MHGLESTVAHGFVKHGFKVLLHHVVYGPLQASRCLVLQSFNEPRSFIPSIPLYFGSKLYYFYALIDVFICCGQNGSWQLLQDECPVHTVIRHSHLQAHFVPVSVETLPPSTCPATPDPAYHSNHSVIVVGFDDGSWLLLFAVVVVYKCHKLLCICAIYVYI